MRFTQIQRNNYIFYLYEIILHIIIIISISLSYILKDKLVQPETHFLNNYEFTHCNRRNLDKRVIEEEKDIIDKILKELSKKSYKGKWRGSFDNDYNNYIYLTFKNKKNKRLKIEIRQITENYLINWNRIKGEIDKENFYIFENEEKNTIEFDVSFKAKVESGKIVNSVYSLNLCNINLNFEIPKNNTLNFINLNGNIYSICKDIQNCDFKIKKNCNFFEFFLFFLFSIIVVVLNNLNIVFVRKRFDENFADGITLFIIYENIRHYLCFVQFLFILIIDLKIYIIFFWIVLILNYPFIEMRFFNLIWRIKYKDQLSNPNLRKKIMCKSMLSFFFATFFSLLSVSRFYFTKENYYINSILTFTPQIIYNIINKNDISIPYSICFCYFLSKMYILFYFNVYKKNILLIKNNDFQFIYIIIGIYIITFLFLLSQQIFGPIWFIPCKKKERKKKDIFKSKKEILKIKPDLINEICVICLSPLFKQEKEKIEITLDLNDSKNLEKKELNVNKEEEENIKIKNSCKEIILSLFEFELNQIKIIKRPYIFLNCHHCFHFDCVLGWLKKKNLCPVCRTSL